MRYPLIPLAVVLLAVPMGFAYVHWSKGGAGTGLYSRHWSPDPVQGYWDPENFYRSPETVQGVFWSSSLTHHIVLTTDGGGRDRFQVVYHEFFHLLTSRATDRLPPWLAEGLAEFYSNLIVRGVSPKTRAAAARCEDGAMSAPVLVATHDTPHADLVLERAAALAVAVAAELHAVSVVAPIEINAAVGDAGAVVIAGMEHELEVHSQSALERARNVGVRHGLDVVAHLAHGEPAAAIVNVADEIGADMIVLGSTGLDAAGRYVLGSVPERVLFDPHGHDVHVVRTTT